MLKKHVLAVKKFKINLRKNYEILLKKRSFHSDLED